MARELARESTPADAREGPAVGRRLWLRLCATTIGTALVWLGLSERGGDPDPTRTLTVTSTSVGASNYEITVSDVIVASNPAAGHVGTGPSAEDAIGSGSHSYRFDGRVTDLRAGADTAVYVDGERVA
jgi:hypothetical protein